MMEVRLRPETATLNHVYLAHRGCVSCLVAVCVQDAEMLDFVVESRCLAVGSGIGTGYVRAASGSFRGHACAER